MEPVVFEEHYRLGRAMDRAAIVAFTMAGLRDPADATKPAGA
ncbi:MAG: hypothetical protein ACRDGI_11490 [Candidatus Limnocylindrales bacterium]